MAMIENAQTAPFGAVTTYRATNVFYSLVEAVSNWFQTRIEARRTAAALSRLSPQMLDDIGLTHGDVMEYQRQAGML